MYFIAFPWILFIESFPSSFSISIQHILLCIVTLKNSLGTKLCFAY